MATKHLNSPIDASKIGICGSIDADLEISSRAAFLVQIPHRDEHLRLWGINAPELDGLATSPGGKAKAALEMRVLGKQLIICTLKNKQENYGKYLAKIYIGNELINDWLAVPYMRGGQ